MIIPETHYNQLFTGADVISADFILRIDCAKDSFLRRIYPNVKQYNDTNKFFYLITTIAVDEQYAGKYIKSVNARRFTDEQLALWHHIVRLHSEHKLCPNNLWILLYLHKYDADDVIQSFDIDIKRGRRRCINIIKKYFV